MSVPTRPPLPHDEQAVKEALQARIEGLCLALGFREKAANGVITPLNPRRDDRKPGSFVIWTSRSAGAWKDYATGEKGDVFDLIRYVLGLSRWIDAYWWALNYLGWGRHEVRSAEDVQLAREKAERERKAAAAREDAEREAKAARARAFWLRKCRDDAMKPGPVWSYLTGVRGLPLERLAAWPNAIRWHPSLEHFDKVTGEVTEWPAICVALSPLNGGISAVHRTWLAPDGSDKAPVAKARKMTGVAKGAAGRLTKGAGNLTPEEAVRRGVTAPLIITEGLEDALVAAIAQPDVRVWFAGSLDNMGELAWPACCSSVVLVADNDWETPEAVAAFDRVVDRWKSAAAGRPVKVVRADKGKDLNDWARAGSVPPVGGAA